MPSLDPRQAASLEREIERIKTLDLDDLGRRWRNAFGKRVPRALPKTLLVKALIYSLQADALGDLDAHIVRILERYAARNATGEPERPAREGERARPAVSASLNIKPGSVLVREWRGRMHRVMALEAGFAWEGLTYRSLSEVARAITGARWNGRRFFGIDRKSDISRSSPERSNERNVLVTRSACAVEIAGTKP